MNDEVQIIKLRLEKLEEEVKKDEEKLKRILEARRSKRLSVVATGSYFFHDSCPVCDGTGWVRSQRVSGWYIDYHYQDGHETCGPYEKADAVKRVRGHSDLSSIATLIGPDGQIYKLSEKQ